jgi:flavin reductase (DIM6/NTAB) family NADH-FMN oxidoreductase RutF
VSWSQQEQTNSVVRSESQGCAKLLCRREGVVNLPGPRQWQAVDAIAATTGREPVSARKAARGYRHEPDKFTLGGFTRVPSDLIAPPRIAECPLQLEVRVLRSHETAMKESDGTPPGFLIIEARVEKAHAHEDIIVPGTQRVCTDRWSPLLYVFRHYFGTGERRGRNFRAED